MGMGMSQVVERNDLYSILCLMHGLESGSSIHIDGVRPFVWRGRLMHILLLDSSDGLLLSLYLGLYTSDTGSHSRIASQNRALHFAEEMHTGQRAHEQITLLHRLQYI